MPDKIYQLIYTSSATHHCGPDEIREIAVKAAEFNETVGLTGMLLVSAGRFIQLLEGPETPLFDLYERIKQDPRHVAVQTHWQATAEERLMPTWSMGHLYLNAPEQGANTRFTQFLNTIAQDCQSQRKQVEAVDVLKAFIGVFGDELDQKAFLAFVDSKHADAA